MKRTFKLIITVISVVLFFAQINDVQPVIAGSTDGKYVALGGEPFGIRMFSKGVVVIDAEATLLGSDIPSPAKIADIRKNDVILTVNGTDVNSNEKLAEIINEFGGDILVFEIKRENNTIFKEIKPQCDSQGIYRIGLWVKDSAAGIGTITYYDAGNNTFGALGHGICEAETGVLMPINYGEIAKAEINSITKSKNGQVGSLNGHFLNENIGTANLNTEYGVFGTSQFTADLEFIETATKSEVRTGKAQIYCTVDDNNKEAYDIKIRRLNVNFEDIMLIEITDKDLIDITGGIVQGMSGSPIVQDGKLVGAVSHVLVNNVKCGYGVYIENMLEENEVVY